MLLDELLIGKFGGRLLRHGCTSRPELSSGVEQNGAFCSATKVYRSRQRYSDIEVHLGGELGLAVVLSEVVGLRCGWNQLRY